MYAVNRPSIADTGRAELPHHPFSYQPSLLESIIKRWGFRRRPRPAVNGLHLIVDRAGIGDCDCSKWGDLSKCAFGGSKHKRTQVLTIDPLVGSAMGLQLRANLPIVLVREVLTSRP